MGFGNGVVCLSRSKSTVSLCKGLLSVEGNNYFTSLFYFTSLLYQFYATVWSGSAKEGTPSKERFHQPAETSRSWAGSGRGGIQQRCCGHCPLLWLGVFWSL